MKPIYRSPAGEQAVLAAYEQILGYWPDSTERLQLDTRHGLTSVLALGERSRPPLVLLHGAGSNALAWGGDVPELARHFRVYAVDTPGEPGRSCQERIPWQGEGIVEWLDDVLTGVGAPRALLAGISQGGYIALRFAAGRPDRVRALALLAPGGVTPVRPGFLLRGVGYSLLNGRGTDALLRHTLGDCELPEVAWNYTKLIFTHFRSRMDAQPLLTDAQLRGLRLPVLLMAGDNDAVFDSRKTASRFSRLVKSADVRLLPGAGHALVNVAAEMVPFFLAAAGDRPAG